MFRKQGIAIDIIIKYISIIILNVGKMVFVITKREADELLHNL